MITHFISDLHLSDEQPQLLRLFTHYLEQYAPRADRLYILGDLFEVWIGDDYQPQWLMPFTHQLNNLAEQGTSLYFCHGNRDFLLGNNYAKQANLKLLPEYSTIDLFGQSVLLCHGDTLCTDDTAYQDFRQQVRSEQWQQEFLSLPVEQRLAIVNNYRQQSKQATAEKSQEIMDVNADEVSHTFQHNDVEVMIHGHTHRPAIHRTEKDNTSLQRIVLSDWRDYGQYLEADSGIISSFHFDTKSRWDDPDIPSFSISD
ncbi:UDP-2,3-diacylglucosamine diphosphatase [Pleionea mediterranea]|uniref:UDP-2,3-diacylglucosamine hydrolase n=1 Tax=Pleionea mediterranea TaxID=523701 RepID=A0A316FXR3_9GAMM|nr:UDP-2,3-diacylglucosamine diphosphatase [Pleionea mediterranea]PWK53379.1 UDP-2,3-diacylglucosamine hydrolase [Pleionea mediterranea]